MQVEVRGLPFSVDKLSSCEAFKELRAIFASGIPVATGRVDPVEAIGALVGVIALLAALEERGVLADVEDYLTNLYVGPKI